jgi:Ca2+-binding RTX toxin-like protein
MSFENFLPKINFPNLNPAFTMSPKDIQDILDILRTAYNDSGAAREMMDYFFTENTIFFEKTPVETQARYLRDVRVGQIFLNYDQIKDLLIITPTGQAIQASLTHIVIHEIIHVMKHKFNTDGSYKDSFEDNVKLDDYQGETVKFSNIIYSQLKPPIPLQISYTGKGFVDRQLRRNYNYTNGMGIDIAAVLELTDENLIHPEGGLSTVSNGVSRDLLIGGGDADKLRSGAGEDFLWGMGGNDNLDGGEGKDTAGFYGTKDSYKFGKDKDGKWTVSHNLGAKENGIDTLENIEFAMFDDVITAPNGTTLPTKRKVALIEGQDICLVIDTTRSMDSSITVVRAQIEQMLSTAFGGENSVEASRIAVVTYSDSGIQTLLSFTEHESLEDRRNAVLNAVKGLTTSGKTENTNTALIHALNGGVGEWRSDATARRVILFTDEAGDDNQRQSEVSALAQNLGVEISSVLPIAGYSLQEKDKPKPPPYTAALLNSFLNPFPPPLSPLVLDLDGDGVELTTLAEQVLRFDIDQDGFREATGWVHSDDGLLVYDRNNDGLINDLSELFGTQVIGDSGFNRLQALDTNGDTWISAADTAFTSLLIWRDLNQDGISDNDELFSLNQLGITRIKTTYTTIDQAIPGRNTIVDESIYERVDGTQQKVVDVWFAVDQFNSEYDFRSTVNPQLTFTNEILNLPNLRGYGNLPDLTIAMAKDSQLLNLVRAFTQQMQQANYVGVESAVQRILYQWAGVNGNVTDRGPYIDAQKIAFLEKFFGRGYVEMGLGSSREKFSGPIMNTVFDNLFKALSRRLVAQTLSSSVTYDLLTDRFTYNRKEEIVDQFTRLSQSFTPLNELHANLLMQLLAEERGVMDSDLNGNDIISGGNGTDTIHGIGNDMVYGGTGNDIITAGLGWDTVNGGLGNDILIVDYSSNTLINSGHIQERLAGISTTILSHETGEFSGFYKANTDHRFGYNQINFSNIEHFWIIGTVADDDITTGDGNDTISGGYGKDALRSGDGDDLVFGDHGDDLLDGSSGNDTLYGQNGNDVLRGGDGNDILNGQDGNDNLTGETGNDSLEGGDGSDTLDGGSGDDTLNGGAGNDVYLVDSASDIIWETSDIDSGFDRVESIATHYTLSDNIERLSLAYAPNVFDGTGNSLDNEIVGNNGLNRLFGMTGNDLLRGFAGDDTLAGGEGNDALEGGDGKDRLDGGNGDDTMIGGLGNDSYYVDSASDSIQETSTSTTEIDSVDSLISYTLGNNLENLNLLGSAVNGTGNSLNNFIRGNSIANSLIGLTGNDTLDGYDGNDTLDGGTGNDKLIGGTGNDSYFIDSASDSIQETSTLTTEIDSVTSTITFTLGNNLENLVLAGSNAINGTGNGLNNQITGNIAANSLSGAIGNDTLDGGAGNDTLDGGDGNDSLLGSDGNDRLLGGAGIDTLVGGLGDDTLAGGAANDILTGSGGSDRFLYDTNAIFAAAAIGVDQLTDFTLNTDKIILDKTTFTALRSIAGSGFSTASDFASVTTDAAAATSSAFIAYNRVNGKLFYNQNGTTAGLGTGGQFVTLTGLPNLTASDFLIQA